MAGILEPKGISYLALLAVCIPSTMIAILLTALITNFLGKDLKDDASLPATAGERRNDAAWRGIFEVKPRAKLSVLLFLLGIVAVVLYATAISDTLA